MMRHERETDQSPRQRQQQLEVTAGRPVGKRHLEAIVAPRNLNLMRG